MCVRENTEKYDRATMYVCMYVCAVVSVKEKEGENNTYHLILNVIRRNFLILKVPVLYL